MHRASRTRRGAVGIEELAGMVAADAGQDAIQRQHAGLALRLRDGWGRQRAKQCQNHQENAGAHGAF